MTMETYYCGQTDGYNIRVYIETLHRTRRNLTVVFILFQRRL